MDHTFHDQSLEPCPSKLDDHDNMLGSCSDNSCTSSSNLIMSGKSYEETYKAIEKLSSGHVDESGPSNLIRTPSMPPRTERKDQNRPRAKKGSDLGRRLTNNTKTASMMNLVDAPSMPITSMEVEESQDEEVEFSMGKLIRQASLSNLDALPPRTHVAKGVTTSSRLSRHGSIRKDELSQLEGQQKIRPQRLMSKLKTQKSLNDLQSRELQGFKDLGFYSDKKDSNPPIPNKSTDEIKAQIKFWARAVASNVRQES
ncbi:hypothetical protein DH2020_031631 [Rehmannia glutinosa]|uniref:Uncharacterized protein n=1 Tax=Rehmannia glutinosa TaxID=99300 RepID=A0ABR0VKC6_REHGL